MLDHRLACVPAVALTTFSTPNQGVIICVQEQALVSGQPCGLSQRQVVVSALLAVNAQSLPVDGAIQVPDARLAGFSKGELSRALRKR